MKIGIDIRPLQSNHRYRGTGVYIANLVSHLLEIDHINTYVMYRFPGPDPLKGIAPVGSAYKTVVVPKRMPVFGYMATGAWHPLRVSGIDVMLVPEINFGLAQGAPTVATAYDLIPKIFARQQWNKANRPKGIKYTLGTRLLRAVYPFQQNQFNKATRIIAISEATRDDYLRLFPDLEPAKFSVTPLAAPDATEKLSDIVKRHNLKDYLFYIGGADYRKNVPGLVDAYARVRKAGIEAQLVLAGKGLNDSARLPKLHDAINRSGYTKDIILLGYVSDADAAALFSHAGAFVFPSLYEGFGIPVLEAMRSGCPVIAYNNSSIPEIAGNAAKLVQTGEDLAPAIIEVLTNPKLQQEMKEHGRKQAQKFSWKHTAELTLEALKRAADVKALK